MINYANTLPPPDTSDIVYSDNYSEIGMGNIVLMYL